jgi:hypothetical protein
MGSMGAGNPVRITARWNALLYSLPCHSMLGIVGAESHPSGPAKAYQLCAAAMIMHVYALGREEDTRMSLLAAIAKVCFA